MTSRLFPFVQFEFTHSIGPAPGRYTVGPPTELGSADVVVIRLHGAARWRSAHLRRRPREVADGEPPAKVSLSVVTVVLATSMLADAAAARAFLAEARRSPGRQDELLLRALGQLNRVVRAHRLCAADPYALDLTPLDARASRLGYGPAEHVVLGHWDAALAVQPRVARRVRTDERLMPVEAMTALLAGRAGALESEELILRAVVDLDHGRFRAAAAGIKAARELLLGEVDGATLTPAAKDRLAGVRAAGDEVARLADRARRGPLTGQDAARLRALVEQVGAFVDVWRYKPLGYAEPKPNHLTTDLSGASAHAH